MSDQPVHSYGFSVPFGLRWILALFSANVGPPDLFVRMNAKPSRMSATVIFITYDIYCLSKVYFRTAIYEVLVCLQLKPSIWHHSFG